MMNDAKLRGHGPLLQNPLGEAVVGAGHARDLGTPSRVTSDPKHCGQGPHVTGSQGDAFVGAGHARDLRPPGHAALRKGRASVPNGIYLVTVTTIDRTPYFLDFSTAAAAARCFESRTLLLDATMLAWVLMPDHAHWLLQLGDQGSLGGVVNRLKSASARVANRAQDRNGSLWTRAYHDHALRTDEDLPAIARYIVANPLRAGLVKSVGEYPWWNALWL